MSESKYKMGTLKATSLVAGNMIGSGVLLAPAILAPYGGISILGWILTTVGALALAIAFVYLSKWIPKSGGPFTFSKYVFGDFIGFQMAWGYWISTWCGSVSLLVGAMQYMSIWYPNLVENQMFCIIFCISIVILFTAINMRGIKSSTFFEVIIVIIKILPLILIAIIGVFSIDFSKISFESKQNISPWIALGAMAPTLLWGFIGLESVTITSHNVKHPKRTIPIATISGVLLTASIYICGAIVIYGIIPHNELIASQAPYVDAAKKLCGSWGESFMIITGIAGIYGSLNGWILIQGEVPYAAAKEGLFPKFFLKTNKNGAPYGIIIGSILMIAVFLLTYQPSLVQHVTTLINVSVLAMLLPYFYSAVAFLYILITKKNQISTIESILLYITAFIAITYAFLAIFGSGEKMVFLSTMIFLLSVPCYCFIKKEKKKND